MLYVTIYNQSTEIDDHHAVDLAYALNHQVSRDVAPVWQLRAVHVVLAPRGTPVKAEPGNWPLTLFENTDQAGALGYHDEVHGVPLMKVFVKTCLQDGVSPSSCASHELLEALIDPSINRLADDGAGKAWAIEVGDPVQNDSYYIPGASGAPVEVSNFAFPALFDPQGSGRLDHLGKAKAPFGGSPGGYMQWTSDLANWHQIGEDRMAGKIGRNPRG